MENKVQYIQLKNNYMIFRVARHTNDLKPIIEFYTTIIGLEVLGSFENHNEYDGVFIGKPNLDWHLEFTVSSKKVSTVFDEEDALVFYPTSKDEYDSIINKIEQNTIQKEVALNPYWNLNGVMVLDPDGHPVIVSNFKV